MSDRCPLCNLTGINISHYRDDPVMACPACGMRQPHWYRVKPIAELQDEIARLKAELAAVQSICAWCGRFEYEHGEPGASEYAKAQGSSTWRLCPVVGVTSQFFTARKQLTQAEPRPEGDANE